MAQVAHTHYAMHTNLETRAARTGPPPRRAPRSPSQPVPEILFSCCKRQHHAGAGRQRPFSCRATAAVRPAPAGPGGGDRRSARTRLAAGMRASAPRGHSRARSHPGGRARSRPDGPRVSGRTRGGAFRPLLPRARFRLALARARTASHPGIKHAPPHSCSTSRMCSAARSSRLLRTTVFTPAPHHGAHACSASVFTPASHHGPHACSASVFTPTLHHGSHACSAARSRLLRLTVFTPARPPACARRRDGRGRA
jgi:hypothetical protein